jgi:hypothetical protein
VTTEHPTLPGERIVELDTLRQQLQRRTEIVGWYVDHVGV